MAYLSYSGSTAGFLCRYERGLSGGVAPRAGDDDSSASSLLSCKQTVLSATYTLHIPEGYEISLNPLNQLDSADNVNPGFNILAISSKDSKTPVTRA